MFCTHLDTPLGKMLLQSDGEALTGAWFLGQKHFPQGEMTVCDALPVFGEAKAWLDAYFAGQIPGRLPPLRPAGTPFQLHVWQALTRIPRGATQTYSALALSVGCRSAQAVGGAVGRNPLSIFIPCHRVVGRDGSLTGYAAGLSVKERLLHLETDVGRAQALLAAGSYTCVLCRGEETRVCTARGVKPLVQWLEAGTDCAGFSAADKVAGRGAAFLYCLLGVRAVHAGVLSRPALAVLRENGILATWDALADSIINRRGDGICPFEAAVLTLSDPHSAYTAIRDKMDRMGISF